MGEKTLIEWADATWTPIRGVKGSWSCVKVSPGCTYCYAERLNVRQGGPKYVVGADELRLDETILSQPLRWKRPRRIFVCSMTDLFEERVEDKWIDQVFAVMALARQHQFQILTKRAERMSAYPNAASSRVYPVISKIGNALKIRYTQGAYYLADWPLPNVWAGVSVETPRCYDRIDWLRKTPAVIRFLSLEPLLAPMPDLPLEGISWVIVGGESGGPQERALVNRLESTHIWDRGRVSYKPKPDALEWVRSIRDQCVAAEVPFFFKQWGGLTPKSGGRFLDGKEWSDYPCGAVSR